MAYFAIGLEMAATIYIQAVSLSEAQAKLDMVLSNSIDALDYNWFSDATFGSPALPEISFATAMEIEGQVQRESPRNIGVDEIDRLMRSSPSASKASVLPRSSERFQSKTTSVYWANLGVRATGVLRFDKLAQAREFISYLPEERPPVHWEEADDWFKLDGFEDADYPMILSPNIDVLAVSDAFPLRLHWARPQGG